MFKPNSNIKLENEEKCFRPRRLRIPKKSPFQDMVSYCDAVVKPVATVNKSDHVHLIARPLNVRREGDNLWSAL